MVVGSNLSRQGFKRKAVYSEGAGPVYAGRECTWWGIETWGCIIFLIGF